MKLEVICLCENSDPQNTIAGRQFGLNSLTLSTSMKNNEIQLAVLCDGRPVTQKQMHITENDDVGSMLLELFWKGRLLAILDDGQMIMANAKFHGML
jgi:hypothetical protein